MYSAIGAGNASMVILEPRTRQATRYAACTAGNGATDTAGLARKTLPLALALRAQQDLMPRTRHAMPLRLATAAKVK